MTIDDLDLLADSPDNAVAVPGTPALQEVSKLVAEYDKIQGDLKKIAEAEKIRNERVKIILEQELPSAMEIAGVRAFITDSGRSVAIDEVVRGNIPAISTIDKEKDRTLKQVLLDRRAQAFDIIRKRWPGLLKTDVSVSLGRGEADVAPRIVELLRTQFNISADVDETVHHATLNSHFKELKQQGNLGDVPIEPFALYVGPIAKIK